MSRLVPFVALLVVATLAFGPPQAAAAIFTVTTTGDGNDGTCDADCSLREAVIAANAAADADTIVVPAGTYVLGGAAGEDLAASGDLDLRASVTISGAGSATTIVDGGGVDRIFDVVESATVALHGLTLRNGRVPDGDAQGGGAILWNEAGTGKSLNLTLDDIVVTDNDGGRGLDGGGGIRIEQESPGTATVTITSSAIVDNFLRDGDGGGLHLCCDHLTVTIDHTTITGNTAVDDPNAVGLNGEGGGIYHCCTDTTLTVTNSTISDNDGPTQGGGIYSCCGQAFDTQLTLDRTTVSDNRSLGTAQFQGNGGGIEGEGAVTLINSTLSGNRARLDGGGIDNEDVLVMRNVTIASNEAGRGGGFYEDGLKTTLANVLFAGNVATPGAPADCGIASGTDPLVSLGGNLASDATCPLAGPGDVVGVDPLLAPLADNGGPTRTHALTPASPAVDGGSDANCEAVDQRGRARPADGDDDGTARCDVGAFELPPTLEDCDNGVDDNGNGLVDCFDFDCAGETFCPERCDDCVDDDGDGAIDRADLANCPLRADGAGLGVGDAVRGKLVAKCAGALQKAGEKSATSRAKALRTCVAGLATCVQKSPGDAACLTKAKRRCDAGLAKLPKLVDAARARVVDRCSVLTPHELLDGPGLGFGFEAPRCTELGVPTLAGADDAARCMLAEHACATDRLVAVETPRTAELFALAGLSPAVFQCPPPAAEGSAGGLGTRGKVVDACTRVVQEAGAKLVAATTDALRRCASAVLACRQEMPGDSKCSAKAETACAKLVGKAAARSAALGRVIAKQCGEPKIAATELLGATGAGFQARASFCRALGVPSLESAAALTDCLARHSACRARQMVERELPRLDELLGAGGFALP